MRSRRPRSSLCWFVAWFLGCVSGGRLSAQPRPPSDAPAVARAPQAAAAPTLARAHDHFVLGRHFYRARNFREALREFELAAALLPNAEVWLHLGRTHEELGEYSQAVRAFAHYLRERPNAADAPAMRAQLARLDALARTAKAWESEQAKTGSLRIHSRSPQAQVFVDGRLVEPTALHAPLLLSAGRHRFDVIAPAHVSMHAMVDIQPGLLTAAYADLRPTTRARMLPAAHGLDFALFGVAGAGALTAATFAALSAMQRASGSGPSAEAWAVRTDLALAGTALCALAAALVYYGTEQSAQTQLTPAFSGLD